MCEAVLIIADLPFGHQSHGDGPFVVDPEQDTARAPVTSLAARRRRVPAVGLLASAAVVAILAVGLVVLRYVVGVEPLASMPAEDLVAVYAPTLQRYLTGPLP